MSEYKQQLKKFGYNNNPFKKDGKSFTRAFLNGDSDDEGSFTSFDTVSLYPTLPEPIFNPEDYGHIPPMCLITKAPYYSNI